MGRLLNNLLEGAASVLVLIPSGPPPQIRSAADDRSDREALMGDMERIRGDFDNAWAQVIREKQAAN